jgi:predicted amidophosphoribosyltransferase
MGLLTSKIKCGNSSFTHFYLCPYLPLTAGKDTLSHSLLKFKQRIQPDLDAWIDCSTELLGLQPFSADTIIIRALRHDETAARTDLPSALDLLGQSLATRLGCRYLPNFLYKSRTTLPNKLLSRRQRRSQIQDVYQVATPVPAIADSTPIPDIAASSPFLLIDDILTTGATMRALIQTLRHHYPNCPIKTFTLTRADYRCLAQSLVTRGEICTPETLRAQIFANTV